MDLTRTESGQPQCTATKGQTHHSLKFEKPTPDCCSAESFIEEYTGSTSFACSFKPKFQTKNVKNKKQGVESTKIT